MRPRGSAVICLLTIALATADDPFVGYYLEPDASDYSDETAFWHTTSGSIGACERQNHHSTGDGSIVAWGLSCGDNVVVNHYSRRDSDTNSVFTTTWTATDPCGRFPCVSLTVFQAPPAVAPSVVLITCAGDMGLPTGATVLYRQLEAPTSSARGTRNTQTTQTTGTNTPEAVPGRSHPNVGVIVGAVVGSLAGFGILAGSIAWVWLSRRRASSPKPQGPSQPSDVNHTKPELDGTDRQGHVRDIENKLRGDGSAQWTPAAELSDDPPRPPELEASPQPQELWSQQVAYGGGGHVETDGSRQGPERERTELP
ncbi:hypothetical protein VTK73DRAFT_7372 [Phialemonium thermophilum]|uniref:Uncharacterized protein n=1 Tax=Phialemonium thermophilum TaxID=223376 RepID=A0ABR3WF14_9PEZI